MAKRPPILCVIANKGGVGKTTIARFLAENASLRHGLKTLAVDLDPQGSLSKRWLNMELDVTDPDGVLPPVHPDSAPDDPWRSSTADPFNNVYPSPYPTPYNNLFVLPAHGSPLREAAKLRNTRSEEDAVSRIDLWLRHEDFASEEYDLVIIDTYPDKGLLLDAALRASSHALIPTELEKQSMEAVGPMVAAVRRANRTRHVDPLRVVGILANKVSGTRALHREYVDTARGHSVIGPLFLQNAIGRRAAIAESDLAVGSVSLLTTPLKAYADVQAMLFEVLDGVLNKVMNNG